MSKSIDSCLRDEGIEIIIVNDGSTDNTAEIAEEYTRAYPGIIQTIHQKNKGHGGAINTGLKAASGRFVKIVDSDDWLDSNAYDAVFKALCKFDDSNCPDMVVSNYTYDKAGKKSKTTIRYTNTFPVNKIFTWYDVKKFRLGHYLLMHAITYRLDLLRECDLSMPEHTFYVDSIYAYLPLVKVEKMYYVNENLYQYAIGREDQSVQEKTMINRIDQQLAVNRTMIKSVNMSTVTPRQKQWCMMHYLSIVTTVSSILLLKSGTKENLEKKRALWCFIAQKDKSLYKRLLRCFLGRGVNLKGRVGRKIAVTIYNTSQRFVGFS